MGLGRPVSQGLQKATLKVLLAGLNQETVAKLLPIGASLELENMYPDHTGQLVKRYGSTALSTGTIPSGGTLPRAWSLGTHKGALVRLARQGSFPPLAEQQGDGAWLRPTSGSPLDGVSSGVAWSRGPIIATSEPVAQQTVVGNSYDHHESAYGAGYHCVTFQEETQSAVVQIHQKIVDATTGTTLIDRTVASTHQLFPHVMVLLNRYACFAYNLNGSLVCDVFDLSLADPTAVHGTITNAAEPIADTPIDLAPSTDGSKLIVGYRGQSGQFRAATLDPAAVSTVSKVNLENQSLGAIVANVCFAWVQNLDAATWLNGYPALVTCDSSTGVVEHVGFAVIDATHLSAGRTTTVDAGEHAFVLNIAAATAGPGGTGTFVSVDVMYGTTSGNVPAVKHAAVSSSGSVALDVNVLDVFLVSKIFRDSGATTPSSLFMVVTPWQAQATFYVLPIRANPSGSPGNAPYPAPVCRALVQDAYPQQPTAHLPLPAVADGNTVYLSAGAQMEVAAQPPEVNENISLIKIQFRNGIETTLPAPILGNPVEAIDSMFVPGGQLGAWDGRTFGVAGFAYGPQAPSLTSSGASGGLTQNNTYSYAAVYTWWDAQGRKWRSTPSAISTHATGTATSIGVAVNYLELLDKQGVVVEIYRDTATTPGVLQKLPNVFSNAHDDPSNTSLTFTDGTSDATVVQGEFLYTTGGVLANQITPGAIAVAIFDNRLWFVSADDPQSLWPSNTLTPPGTGGINAGSGLIFNGNNIVDARDDRGPIIGIAVVDGQFVVFKYDAIYTVTGTGPDATGVGSTYSVTRVSSSVGCDNPRSIVPAFDGIWFRSSSARAPFWTLDRGLGLNYIGNPRDLGGLTVTGAISIPEQSQIRWYTNDSASGRVIVYDVTTRQWSTFTSPTSATAAACVIAFGGVAVWSTEDTGQLGALLRETANVYQDGNSVFGQKIAGSWLQIADVDGYQRTYRIQGVGVTVGDHSLTVNLYRDLLDTDIILASSPLNMFAANQRWDWEVRPPVQKLSAVKVEMISAAANTAGFACSAYAVVYGVKAGLRKTSWTQRLT